MEPDGGSKMPYKVHAGIAYHVRGESNLEFNPETTEELGKVIIDLVKDERDALNFTISIVPQESEEEEEDKPMGKKHGS